MLLLFRQIRHVVKVLHCQVDDLRDPDVLLAPDILQVVQISEEELLLFLDKALHCFQVAALTLVIDVHVKGIGVVHWMERLLVKVALRYVLQLLSQEPVSVLFVLWEFRVTPFKVHLDFLFHLTLNTMLLLPLVQHRLVILLQLKQIKRI